MCHHFAFFILHFLSLARPLFNIIIIIITFLLMVHYFFSAAVAASIRGGWSTAPICCFVRKWRMFVCVCVHFCDAADLREQVYASTSHHFLLNCMNMYAHTMSVNGTNFGRCNAICTYAAFSSHIGLLPIQIPFFKNFSSCINIHSDLVTIEQLTTENDNNHYYLACALYTHWVSVQ